MPNPGQTPHGWHGGSASLTTAEPDLAGAITGTAGLAALVYGQVAGSVRALKRRAVVGTRSECPECSDGENGVAADAAMVEVIEDGGGLAPVRGTSQLGVQAAFEDEADQCGE